MYLSRHFYVMLAIRMLMSFETLMDVRFINL